MAIHELSKWILRVMIVLGAIGFGTIYVQRNGWTVAEMPNVFDRSSSSSEAAPTPAAVVAEPASSAAPVAGAATAAAAPCQPIGRTGRGELVYSMDCQQLPQAAMKK
jgi:hypothetical protein